MKWVLRVMGGLAGALVLAVVVLLAMGQRADAGRIHTSVDIAAPRARIWPWLSDGERAKRWVSWLVEVRPAGPGPSAPQPYGVGRSEVWVMQDENNHGQLMEVTGTCTEYAEPERLTASLSAEGQFAGTQSYRLVDLGNGRTRLTVDGDYRFSQWWARLLEPMITPEAKKKMDGDLARLKSAVESAPE